MWRKTDLSSEVTHILNLITDQNFVIIQWRFQNVLIANPCELERIFDLVLLKVMDDPMHSRLYAILCDTAVPRNVSPKTIKTTFESSLLQKCQEEFERDGIGEQNIEAQNEKIDPRGDYMMKMRLENALDKDRRKAVNLARFFGEWCKLDMNARKNFMLSRIGSLLDDNNTPKKLECMCVLLTTAGQELSECCPAEQDSSDQLKGYFERIKILASHSATSVIPRRIQFMLRDVFELRERNWVPRQTPNFESSSSSTLSVTEKQRRKKDSFGAMLDRFKTELGITEALCGECSKLIVRSDRFVKCGGECSKLFHISCAKMNRQEFKSLLRLENKVLWLCDACRLSTEKFFRPDSSVSEALSAITAELQIICKRNVTLAKNLENLAEENASIKSDVESVLKRLPLILLSSEKGSKIVDQAELANNPVDQAELANNPVDQAELANNPVDQAELVNNPVDQAELANNPVDQAELANNPVDQAELANNPVDQAELANNPFDQAQLVNDPVDQDELVNNPVDQAELANNPVDQAELANNPVDQAELANNPVDQAELANNPVDQAELANNPVDQAELANNPVDQAELANNPVDQAELFNDPVDQAELVNDPVYQSELVNDPVDQAELANNPVDQAELVNNPVDQAELVNDPVDQSKLANNPVDRACVDASEEVNVDEPEVLNSNHI